MARNFRICAIEKSDKALSLRLFGCFDGSSACELIDILDRCAKKTGKVAIDTNGLRTVNDFGIRVFHTRFYAVGTSRKKITVVGRFRGAFQKDEDRSTRC